LSPTPGAEAQGRVAGPQCAGCDPSGNGSHQRETVGKKITRPRVCTLALALEEVTKTSGRCIAR
jgi:hypothetical protein